MIQLSIWCAMQAVRQDQQTSQAQGLQASAGLPSGLVPWRSLPQARLLPCVCVHVRLCSRLAILQAHLILHKHCHSTQTS